MSAAERNARYARTPKPLQALTRPELAARIATLRGALDDLWVASERDGGPAYGCIGACKIHLLELERDLFKRDQAADRGEPLPLPVALAMVVQPDVAALARSIALDGARALAGCGEG